MSSKGTAKLRAVTNDEPKIVDIYASWRAEIEARDWRKTHVAGDRNPPLWMGDRVKRIWR